ncbi:MAG: hypothetical protein [Olavius algarvensis Gamma 3 endosymbiont]|nr:MAG: hypothetical protein [Olavius algarvensis Gamma 3 endosymbiont]
MNLTSSLLETPSNSSRSTGRCDVCHRPASDFDRVIVFAATNEIHR